MMYFTLSLYEGEYKKSLLTKEKKNSVLASVLRYLPKVPEESENDSMWTFISCTLNFLLYAKDLFNRHFCINTATIQRAISLPL